MKSMTGMGRAEGLVLGMSLRLEIKAINHRFCEISLRSPSRYQMLEFHIHRRVKERVGRGKIDVFLFEEKRPELSALEIKAFQSYHEYLLNVLKTLKLKDEVELADLLSGVNSWIAKDVDVEALWAELGPLLEKAIEDLDGMRLREGQNLAGEFKLMFAHLGKVAAQITAQAITVKVDLEKRFTAKISEKIQELSGVDEQRLHTEVLFLLERMDITEELVRLKSHLEQAEKFLKSTEPVGRKLDFLIQEINREFNTIASKAQNSGISHLVVEAKSELEKIREQVQNIE